MDKYTIYILTLIIIYYLFISDKLYDNKINENMKHIPIIMTLSAAFFIIILSITIIFVFRTTYYINHLDNENTITFNGISDI